MANPIQAFMQGVTKLYDTATGKYAYQKSKSGAAYTSDQALAITQGIEDGSGGLKSTPSDILPILLENVNVFAATPIAADIVEIDFAKASHTTLNPTIDGTALVVSCSGASAFQGVIVTINQLSTASALTAMTAFSGNGASPAPADTDHTECFFCPAGQVTLIPYNQVINLVHVVSRGETDGSEDNIVQVSLL